MPGALQPLEVREFELPRLEPGAALLRTLDTRVIDAAALGVGGLTEALSQRLRGTVSGHAQHYGLMMAAGVLIALALAVFGR